MRNKGKLLSLIGASALSFYGITRGYSESARMNDFEPVYFEQREDIYGPKIEKKFGPVIKKRELNVHPVNEC